jgi:dihydrofolate synthase/folylpolyglutamate synthase
MHPVATEAAAALADGARLALPGAHQRGNARIAAAVGRRLGVPDAAILRGLETVVWPGRLETVTSPHGVFLLDAAHNPDGIEALTAYLATQPGPKLLVFGALADKDWAPMLDRLAPAFASRHYAPPRGRAATPPETLAARHGGTVHPDVKAALLAARAEANARLTRDGAPLVVVAGSIYLVGEARGFLLGLPEDPPVAL